MASTLVGSSTTQITRRSRVSSVQIGHGSASVTLLQAEQYADLVLHVAQRLGEALGLVAGRLHDVERQALRALAPDAGQALQLRR